MEKKWILQLRRVKGQIGGVEKMMIEGVDCEKVLMQLSAAVNSLKSVSRQVLAEQAAGCMKSIAEKKNYDKLLQRFF